MKKFLVLIMLAVGCNDGANSLQSIQWPADDMAHQDSGYVNTDMAQARTDMSHINTDMAKEDMSHVDMANSQDMAPSNDMTECKADTTSDNNNCGKCGNVCWSNTSCTNSECMYCHKSAYNNFCNWCSPTAIDETNPGQAMWACEACSENCNYCTLFGAKGVCAGSHVVYSYDASQNAGSIFSDLPAVCHGHVPCIIGTWSNQKVN